MYPTRPCQMRGTVGRASADFDNAAARNSGDQGVIGPKTPSRWIEIMVSPRIDRYAITSGLFKSPSRDCDPGAVGIAAGGAAGELRLAVDVDRVRVLPAGHGIALVGRTWNDGATAACIIIAPAYRRAGRARLERLDLRLIGARAILVIERSADAVADQSTDGGARDRARHTAAAASELRADDRAANCAHKCSGVLMRSGAGLRIARAGAQQKTDQSNRPRMPQSHRNPSPIHLMEPIGARIGAKL